MPGKGAMSPSMLKTPVGDDEKPLALVLPEFRLEGVQVAVLVVDLTRPCHLTAFDDARVVERVAQDDHLPRPRCQRQPRHPGEVGHVGERGDRAGVRHVTCGKGDRRRGVLEARGRLFKSDVQIRRARHETRAVGSDPDTSRTASTTDSLTSGCVARPR